MNLLYHFYEKFVLWVYSRDRERLVIESLKPRTVDRDELMIHAAFQILKDWFEKEKGIEWWCSGLHPSELPQGAHRDLYLLYLWWTKERPHRAEMQPADMDGLAWDRQCDEEDQSKLLALIGLRGYLWT